MTRDEAKLDLKVRMDTYEPEKTDFTYSQTGEKIGTGLLATYHSDLGGKNVMMKELRKNERLKRKTEKMIAKARGSTFLYLCTTGRFEISCTGYLSVPQYIERILLKFILEIEILSSIVEKSYLSIDSCS